MESSKRDCNELETHRFNHWASHLQNLYMTVMFPVGNAARRTKNTTARAENKLLDKRIER